VIIEKRAFPRAHPGGGSGNTSRKACMKLGGSFPPHNYLNQKIDALPTKKN